MYNRLLTLFVVACTATGQLVSDAKANLTSVPSNWTTAPSNWTSPPSNWTHAPSNWTKSPSNWTHAPSNWTHSPSNWTHAPSNWTHSPSNWTHAPSNWTHAPSNWTKSPSNWTHAPSNWTHAPSNWTKSPSNWTHAPSNWTHAPSNWTHAPSNWTKSPSNWTHSPSNWTHAPSNWTHSPSNWTHAPSNWTHAPSNWTKSPSNWTHAPSNWTHAPSNWTKSPSNWTHAPSNWTHAPSNWTKSPSNWTHAPSNWTHSPSNWTHAPSNWTKSPSNWTHAPSNWTHAPSNWTKSPSNSSAFECYVSREEQGKWTEEQRMYCCLYEGVGCKANKDQVDCFMSSNNWNKTEKEYCCMTADIGCAVNCSVEKSLLSKEEVASCCNRTGLHCDAKVAAADVAAAAAMVAEEEGSGFKLSFRGDWKTVSRNPKRKVQLFRMSMIAASKTLQKDPSSLIVTYFGTEKSGEEVPSTGGLSDYGYNVPSAWNVDNEMSVAAVKNAAAASPKSTRRVVSVLGETVTEAAKGKDGLFFDYYITGKDVDVISGEVESSKKTVLQSNNEGYSLILTDAEISRVMPATETSAPSPSSSSSKGWIFALVGSIVGLCAVGGMVAFYLTNKKKNNSKLESNQLVGLEAIEVKAASDDKLSDLYRQSI